MFREFVGMIPPAPSVTTGIVARAGGGKASATPITTALAEVATVATAADSVLLPLAKRGLCLFVRNAAANSMQVFGAGTDTINGVATGTGVAQAGGASALYVCLTNGAWVRLLSA